MAQQHVDLIGDLAAALMEVPSGLEPCIIFSERMGGAYASFELHGHSAGADAADALRRATANRGSPATWFTEAYERAYK